MADEGIDLGALARRRDELAAAAAPRCSSPSTAGPSG